MASTRLSTKGQLILPKAVRDAKRWGPGTELEVEDRPDGVLLKLKRPAKRYKLEDIIGILKHKGPPVSIEEMDDGISKAVRDDWERGSR